MSRPLIKICGLKDPSNIEEVILSGPHYIGFIFYPNSARYVGKLNPECLTALKNVKKTAVFVNSSSEEIKDILNKYQFDEIQLHGDESPESCALVKELGVEVIKAFGVSSAFDYLQLEAYLPIVDYFLFDTKTPIYGGSGESFNWDILKKYPYSKPYFLSGGIGPDNFKEAYELEDERLYALDLNSRFETSPGFKDITLLEKVLKNRTDNE